jgi:hypothetical protein
MGAYKQLQLNIEAGDTAVALSLAKSYEQDGQLEQALKWYKILKNNTKITEIQTILDDAEEDIFA